MGIRAPDRETMEPPAPAAAGADGGPPAAPSRAVRWFIRLFLATFVVCCVFGIEWWPFTGFRLFSRLRTPTRLVWMADTVGPGGRASPLWFSQLPRAYQGFELIMPGFNHLPASTQRSTCDAWLSEARRVRPTTIELLIYRERWRALPRQGDRGAPPRRSLQYACR